MLLCNILNMCKDKASKGVRQALLIGKFPCKSPAPGSASIQYWLLRAGSDIHSIGCESPKNASWVLPHQTTQIVTHENATGCQKQFLLFLSLSSSAFSFSFPRADGATKKRSRSTVRYNQAIKIIFQLRYFLLKYNYVFVFVMLFVQKPKGWKQKFGHWLISLWGTEKIQKVFIQGFCFVSFFSNACLSLQEDQAFPCAGRLIRW